jgi:hypothetical protein
MLVIRKEQMQALKASVELQFEERLGRHLFEAFTRQCERLGAAQVGAVVRLGVARARRHGYVGERDVFLWLCLMLMLGSFFDDDPQLQWVADIVGGPSLAAGDRAPLLRLHAAAMSYLDRVAGEDNEHLVKALIRVRDFDAALFRDRDQGGLLAELPRICEAWYPQKAAVQGPAATGATMTTAAEQARARGLTSSFGQGIYAGVAFMLGAGFAGDPQFPWASAALATDGAGDGRAAALYAEAMAYLQFGLAGE